MNEWEQEQDPAETYGDQDKMSEGGREGTKGAADAELPGTYTTHTDPPKTKPDDDD